MVVNLFIDTNVFLAFYHLTSEDLEELKKLSVLIQNGEIRLFLPDQVKQEFHRNREAKIADAVKRLRDQSLNLQFPQICKDYDEYRQLRRLQKEYEQVHSELLAKIDQDVSSRQLKADQLIDELFSIALQLDTTPVLVEQAKLRMDLGNPPGKSGSLGDAIIWETLLQSPPNGEAFHFVTDDKDYGSPLDSTAFNGYLLDEWRSVKSAELLPYKRLSDFFKSQFPKIELASDLEKDLLITQLANSPNFASTHSIIAKLRKFTDFSTAQANAIAVAAATNTQVHWILNDDDVRTFIVSLLEGHENQLDDEAVNYLTYLLQEGNNEYPDE